MEAEYDALLNSELLVDDCNRRGIYDHIDRSTPSGEDVSHTGTYLTPRHRERSACIW